ncbi:MAG: hypothetical protein AAFP20_17295 [Cyanobacteria bacterium J06614_10]
MVANRPAELGTMQAGTGGPGSDRKRRFERRFVRILPKAVKLTQFSKELLPQNSNS